MRCSSRGGTACIGKTLAVPVFSGGGNTHQVWEYAQSLPSGAKARVDFAELYGTAKALPFQSNVKSGRQAKTRLATGGVE
jgi:hypothetical protein